MNSSDIRTRFLEFFKKNGHAIILSSSLVPQNDPSVLFTTAGMQQFKPYYIGKADAEKDFGAMSTASVQKCVRTSDIDEVGDERHLTFFEMLGNFSFGGYGKEEAIRLAHEFITKEMGLRIDYVSVFAGEEGIPADEESEKYWKTIDPNITVKRSNRADNFWGPTGDEGPCGPTTEVYVDGLEVWNIVFNEFYQEKDKSLRKLETLGIDTGMGLERLALVSRFPEQTGEKTVFDTDLFTPLMVEAARLTTEERRQRIIADHMRASVFLIAEGVTPSNTERGYVLRRLIRRIVLQTRNQMFDAGSISVMVNAVIDHYGNSYPNLRDTQGTIKQTIEKEVGQFTKTIERGIKEFEKGERDAFLLFTTYGFPLELTQELAREKGETLDTEEFQRKMQEHQALSQTGAEQKFKGGLAGHSDMEVKYHTATHLLNAALKKVLGEHVKQKGSNITPERLRFDFAHPQKMTDEEKRAVEVQMNEWIAADLPVVRKEMSKPDAEALGAEMEFGGKYPDVVSVYLVGKEGSEVSKEFCGGPHVEHTGTLGTFSIVKEESVAAGIRRIKAKLL